MKIKFQALAVPSSGTLVILVADGAKLSTFGKSVDKATGGQLGRAIKTAEFTGKSDSSLDVVAPGTSGLDRVIIFGVGKPGELTGLNVELLGGSIAGALATTKSANALVAADIAGSTKLDEGDIAALIASGMRLRTYAFNKYKTGKDDKKVPHLKSATMLTGALVAARKAFRPLDAIATGVHMARDLVNEPANILYPVEFAARAKQLTKLGVQVEVLGEKQMERLKMDALLGVGSGSVRESRLVVMRWNGGPKGEQPVAFVGKGVTFDTGGISIKPSAGMEDMKGDMGGAACVTGLMAAIAGRKANANVIGVIGLVENMPDGKAQRPGDVVTSMSGQTIAVLNTDAEGRLVLADALWYTQKRFKPKFMIDLATLTGAILVTLGKEHAGLFSNNDELSERLHALGEETGEKVWRLPLGSAYDKLIDHEVADVKNTGGRLAGSITAAQFLQRFVNKVPWVHLDVAGMAMAANKTAINQSWGSGWGVRLLDRLVERHYEK
ncbi:MAG: leucyl aminopeptidase [Rhizobiales bacterium]|nr:leucyl aminopeptidase [Hyphomicrobiales bacterium]